MNDSNEFVVRAVKDVPVRIIWMHKSGRTIVERVHTFDEVNTARVEAFKLAMVLIRTAPDSLDMLAQLIEQCE